MRVNSMDKFQIDKEHRQFKIKKQLEHSVNLAEEYKPHNTHVKAVTKFLSNYTELHLARQVALSNMTIEMVHQEIGKFLGGRVEIRVIFDERNRK